MKRKSYFARHPEVKGIKEKLSAVDGGDFLQIPDTWEKFAPLCQIRSGEGLKAFNPYLYQESLIEAVQRHRTTVITKTRQTGITEAISNFFLFNAIKNPGYLGVIFSKNQQDTSNIAKRLRRQLESLSLYTKSKTDNLQDIELVSGGRLLFRNSTINGSRGLESVHHILFDECSFVDELEEIYKATIPTQTMVGANARTILLSTPNGQSGFYFDKLNNYNDFDFLKLCDDIRDQNIDPVQVWTDQRGWGKVVIHWYAHPDFKDRKDTYLDEIESDTGLARSDVEQEYHLSFSNSQVSAFNALLIRNCSAIEKLERIAGEGDSVFIGIDPSSIGSDYCVAIVVAWNRDKQEYRVIDWYRKSGQSTDYDCSKIAELIEKYHDKILQITCESNGIGALFIQQLAKFTDIEIKTFNTTQESKISGVGKLNLLLEKGKLLIPKNSTLSDELLSYRRNGKKLEAMQGKHDDLVMALLISLFNSPFLLRKSTFEDLF